jgi:type VI secretion system protein ImpA
MLFVKPMVKEGAAPPEARQAPGHAAAPELPATRIEARGSSSGGPPQSRTQALAQLREVAAFFRRTEPHSPVAYLAEKAAHWGEQPLHVWLRSVVKDEASFAHIEEILGVTPQSAN